jgi:hypothetical protein
VLTDEQNQNCAELCHNLQGKLQSDPEFPVGLFFFSKIQVDAEGRRFDDINEEQLQIVLVESKETVFCLWALNNKPQYEYFKGRTWNSRQWRVNAVMTEKTVQFRN